MPSIQTHITRQAGHPWDGQKRPGFDLLEFQAESKAACDAFVAAAKKKFWEPWLVGQCESGLPFGGVLYKPTGILQPWSDSPANPHPGGTVQ